MFKRNLKLFLSLVSDHAISVSGVTCSNVISVISHKLFLSLATGTYVISVIFVSTGFDS